MVDHQVHAKPLGLKILIHAITVLAVCLVSQILLIPFVILAKLSIVKLLPKVFMIITDDMTAVKLFLDAGMDVNAGGGAALGLAAGRGQLEMLQLLLSKGAKPTSNALQFARTRGHKEIERILIEAGAKE